LDDDLEIPKLAAAVVQPAEGGPPVIDFTGQAVIVTGAGRGLGRLYALDLARRGASVIVNDVGSSMDGEGSDSSVADQVVEEIGGEGGIAVASHDSVATVEGGTTIVDKALEHFGRLDAVVSNAGILDTVPFDELPSDSWRRMLSIHLDGSFFLSQPAYRVMKAQGGGRFVFIASSAGLFGQPNSAHYAAAKAGIVGLASAIAIDGAPHGILANTVLPFGYSRMVTETVGDRDELGDEVPFLRAIEPQLVVPMVVFLVSKACTFTHQNFSACAGRFARVFVGLGEGWVASTDTPPTAEAIEAHLAEVAATEPFPGSIFDEVTQICSRLGIPL
jgi:NAD(P)-dependent dehydrogenase (short-subunit alcohol dehydrogenase family)